MRRTCHALWFSLAVSLSLWCGTAAAVDPFLEWKSIRSPHFTLHFPAGAEALAYRVLDIAERVHTRLSPRLRWEPRLPTEIVLSDRMDSPNGHSTPMPFNRIELYAIPPDDPVSFGNFDEWYELLITHEYTHLLHIDKASGSPAALRRVLGRNLFTFPNLFQPLWMVEGLAVHHESSLTPGMGRGQGARYAMMMRAEVRRGVRPFDQVSMTGVAQWPFGEIPYLYGGHFFEFLLDRYGAARVGHLIDAYSTNLVPFLLHSNFRRTLGKETPQLWQEFIAHLETRYGGQLQAIRAAGVVEGERLTGHGHWTGQPRGEPGGGLYYLRDDGATRPTLMRLHPGEGVRAVARVRHGARFDLHPKAGLVVAQPEVVDDRNVYFDLYHIDPESGRTTRLTRGGRYHFAAWDPSGKRLAVVQYRLGGSRLLLLDAHGRERATLWEGGEEAIVSHPDWSPEGERLVASVWRRGRGWELELFDLASRQWRRLTDNDAVEAQPQFAADGTILYTADVGGVFNLHRLEPESGATTPLTNVETGAFAPVPLGDGVVYVGYHAEGYDLYRLPAERIAAPPLLRAGHRPEPPVAVADDGEGRARPTPYAPWRSLRPTTWLPTLELSEEVTEVGAATWGQDALGVHQYSAAIRQEFNFNLTGGDLAYLFDDRLALLGARRHLYDYDGAGYLERIRRQEQWEVNALLPFLSLERTFGLWAGASGVQESEVHHRPGLRPRGESEETVAGIAATFANARRHPRAFSRSDGRDLRLVAESSDAFASDYSGRIYTLDWREFIELPARQVLALRLAGGWGSDAPRPFELGGSEGTGEGVDFLFNVRRYPLRGYPTGLDALSGRRFRLGTLEWRFPVRDVDRAFRRFPLGLHGVHAALFADAGAAWEEGSRPDEHRRGAGVELSADVNLLYLLNLRLRLGAAQGLDEGGEAQLYLTLGSAF